MKRYLPHLVLVLFTVLSNAADKPNVLFIAIDDQNDWIGCMDSHPMVQTPNIDRLADRGTVMTNAHCQAPLCNPSRTSLMVGLRPSTTGIHGLAPWFRDVPQWADLVSLPQHFEANGYQTYSNGKIYHSIRSQPANEPNPEFQHWGSRGGVGSKPPQKLIPTTPFGNHRLMDWGVWPDNNDDSTKGDYDVADHAVRMIEEMPDGKPFFLAAGFFLPHVPCYATQKWFDLYPEDTSVLPPMPEGDRDDTPRSSWWIHWSLPEPRKKWIDDNDQQINLVRSYLASTSFVDSQVGRILDALEESGHADDTIVVLWSDHGYHLGEKSITGKNTLWRNSTRVPIIFAGPGVTAGQKSSKPAELLDIYPTLIDLCDLPPLDHLEGLSLWPQLQDADAPRWRPAITSHNQGNFSIVTEKWRYIHYVDGEEELYDIKSDPHEWDNIASNFPEVVSDLRKWLPEKNVGPVAGSRSRVLTYYDRTPVWEGIAIDENDPIPHDKADRELHLGQ
ncbi:sulfatase [Candidatus Pelagisphaera phototrophica]|uniref:sulfatase n=1 Tax=Candidatus Pelagisphaera phototrophica TaxID=2684113 RepID=UPI0024B6A02F|nr:sulfatase [Candidatus Pelagisphaera phototrophica]